MLAVFFVIVSLCTIEFIWAAPDIASSERRDLAQEYFDHGIYLLEDHHKLEDSIPFFRAATRLNPHESSFWVQLGHAEKAKGYYELARKRYKLAALSGSCADCNSFISETDILIKDAIQDRAVGPDYEGNVLNANVGPMASINFNAAVAGKLEFDRTKPVHIVNIGKFLDIDSLNFSVLMDEYGAELTESYPQSMRERPTKFYTMTVKESLQYMEFPSSAFASIDASTVGMYVQWNMNRSLFTELMERVYPKGAAEEVAGTTSEMLTISPSIDHYLGFPTTNEYVDLCFGNEATAISFLRSLHWFMVTLGEKNAGMFFHEDKLPTSSWQLQVEGSKKWVLCPPINNIRIDIQHASLIRARTSFRKSPEADLDEGNVEEQITEIYNSADFFKDCDCLLSDACVQPVLPENIDESLMCYSAEIRKGDAIYYPAGWWHQTLNTDDINIAISSSLLSLSKIDEFIDDMNEECKHVIINGESPSSVRYLQQSVKYKFSSEICSLLKSSCFELWKSIASTK